MTLFTHSIVMLAPADLVPQAQAFGLSLSSPIRLGFEAHRIKDGEDWNGFQTVGWPEYAALAVAPPSMILASLAPDATDANGTPWTEGSIASILSAMIIDVRGPGESHDEHFTDIADANGFEEPEPETDIP